MTPIQSLQDIYKNAEALSPRWLEYTYEENEDMNNPTLLCFSINYESINYVTLQNERSRKEMDRKIKSMKKKDTWELISLMKEHKDMSVKKCASQGRISREKLKESDENQPNHGNHQEKSCCS